jgi:hypothetical protein
VGTMAPKEKVDGDWVDEDLNKIPKRDMAQWRWSQAKQREWRQHKNWDPMLQSAVGQQGLGREGGEATHHASANLEEIAMR